MMNFRSLFDSSGSKSEFLKTPKAQIGRHQWRQSRGWGYYDIAEEPKSKRAMRMAEKISFQTTILGQMKERCKRSFRGSVAAEVWINTTSPNPPHIYTATKNILDLFGKPLRDSGITRKGLVYQDDRQIKYLAISYSLGGKEPGISGQFMPMGYFLQDLKLAEEILSGNYNEYIDNYRSFRLDFDDDDLDEFSHLSSIKSDKDYYIKSLGKDAYDNLVKYSRMQDQNAFLRQGELGIREASILYRASGTLHRGLGTFPNLEQFVQKYSAGLAKWIVHSPIKIQLPTVPVSEGESKNFREEAKESMHAYREKFSTLMPLLVPVQLVVLYKPPLTTRGFSKDLDNIMRLILPFFHEEFKPPPMNFSFSDLSIWDDQKLDNEVKVLKDLALKSVRHSVSGYEILELPRHPDDSGDGFISIGLAGGLHGSTTLWSKVNKVISELKEKL